MSANSSLAIRIAAIFDNKGIKDADKGVKGLQSSVKKLAGAAGIGLGAAAIVKFGKQAAKAFLEDQKEATRLAQAVKNLGIAFEAPAIEDYIGKLSRMSGVTDSQLRPAMQTLLQITGSVTESQKILAQSLDVSAATGIDVATVAGDIGRAYTGQTKGLKKYNLGLTQAELTSASYLDIQKLLNKTFSGSNAAQLETYAGQMSLLSVAAGEASETIGKSLIDALITVTNSSDTTDFINKIDSVASALGKAIGSVSRFALVIKGLFTNASREELAAIFDPARLAQPLTSTNVLAGSVWQDQQAKLKKAEVDALKRQRELAALQKKSMADAKKKAALDKAAQTLELTRIGLTAALKGQISETDRLSLNLQLAILDKNETAATKLSSQLDAAVKRQNELNAALLATPEAPNPYRNWVAPSMGSSAIAGGASISSGGGGVIPDFNVPANSYSQVGPMGGLSAGVIAGVNPPTINIKVEVAGEDVAAVITQQQTNDSLSGSFNTVNRTNRFAAAGFIPA
jgi:uncharacterized protein Yka (UPF0111/DUF47 family)